MSRKTLGETLAALGVVGSLLFVGLELRQNNELAQAAAYQAMGSELAELWRGVSLNRDFAEIHRRFIMDPLTAADLAEISDTDRYRMVASWVAALRSLEITWRQTQLGLLDEEAFNYFGNDSPGIAAAVGNLKLLWPDVRALMSPDFASFLQTAWSLPA